MMMQRAFPVVMAAIALMGGCSSTQPVVSVAPAPQAVAPAATTCTTVVSMKSNRVVMRSGGCPAGVDTAASLSHYADVEVAVRNLRPGEQTTVTTAAPLGTE